MKTSAEKIRDHLTQQRARAIVEQPGNGLICMYRTNTGLMCAIGCLIPDDEYLREFETRGVVSLVDPSLADSCGASAPKWQLPADISQQEAVYWQNYHDFSAQLFISGEKVELSYQDWINTGDEAHSPAAMFERMRGLFP